ncbi:GNAT family N-acetyltransferase [Candidatus Uhrbacteria bacterium]|nr:GNAT family N-acetyltransferase [Candidatus Uhrbacteria bacterium]
MGFIRPRRWPLAIELKQISTTLAGSWASAHRNSKTMILFGGDRLTCCDEFLAAFDGQEIVALASIAPWGEEGEGTPTIVGLYVLYERRGQGIGSILFEATVKRCVERGFEKIRVDLMSAGMAHVVNRLSEDLRQRLMIVNHGQIMDSWPG